MRTVNKKLLLVVRIVVSVWGLVTGYTLASFIMRVAGISLSRIMHLLVSCATSIIVGAALFSLARPIAVLCENIANLIKKKFIKTPFNRVIAFVLGIMIGGMAGIISGAIVEAFVRNLPARLLICIVCGATFAYLGFLVCEKWLTDYHRDDENATIDYCGYILTYGVFFSPSASVAIRLMNGKIYLLEATLKRLIVDAETNDEAKAALNLYLRLSEQTTIKIIAADNNKTELQQITSLAEGKSLKVITATANELTVDGDVTVIPLSEL